MTAVAAIIVTRGDQDLTPVAASIPEEWDLVIWDNSAGEDLSVYGRYAAIARTTAEVIYVQDDDCIVSDPAFIARTLIEWGPEVVVSNMPREFRHGFYTDHALVGFGAAFHRDAPQQAFDRLTATGLPIEREWFLRTCDIVFTALMPRVLVDVPHEDMPWAHYESRMWKQPGHQAERARMIDLVRPLSVMPKR